MCCLLTCRRWFPKLRSPRHAPASWRTCVEVDGIGGTHRNMLNFGSLRGLNGRLSIGRRSIEKRIQTLQSIDIHNISQHDLLNTYEFMTYGCLNYYWTACALLGIAPLLRKWCRAVSHRLDVRTYGSNVQDVYVRIYASLFKKFLLESMGRILLIIFC